MSTATPIIGKYSVQYVVTGGRNGCGFFIQLPGQELKEARLCSQEALVRRLQQYNDVELYCGESRKFLRRSSKEVIEFTAFEGDLEDLCRQFIGGPA